MLLSFTGSATGITGPYDKPLSNPLRGSRRERRPDPEGQDAPKSCRLAANQGVDLGVFRKPAELFLGESEPAIDGDFENTGDTFDELDLLRTSFDKPCPRTEGPWFIVSGHAVFDFDLHSPTFKANPTAGAYHAGPTDAIIPIRHAYPAAGFQVICFCDG
jgi:hypothetical protein